MRRFPFVIVFLLVIGCVAPARAHAQSYIQNYLTDVGSPNFAVNLPVPNGYINIANGNLHMEIGISSLKQRGNLKLNERLVYDSRIWEIIQYHHDYWWPLNVPDPSDVANGGNSDAGWRFVKGNETGTVAYSYVGTVDNGLSCPVGDGTYYTSPNMQNSMTWTDPGGTSHLFDAVQTVTESCDGSTGSSITGGYATDASGYTVNDDGTGNPIIKDNTGTEVYPSVIDRFGNYWASDVNGNLVDDLGRTPVIRTVNGNVTYYDVLAPNGPPSNNGRLRYTVTMEQIPLSTHFNQSGVTEYQNNNGEPSTVPAIQTIQLPDGSSYQFQYDPYGSIQSVQLPTGGTVGYGWTNYQDSYQNVNHWLSSSTIDGFTTNYTPSVISQCSSNGTGCQEQVNVHRPSGDETVYQLTLNNGAWNTATTTYAGAATSGQSKFADATTYNFANACNNAQVCSGAQYITKATDTQTLPDAQIQTQTQTTYSNPETGQMTYWSQWDYFPVGSTPSSIPTREIVYGYLGYDLNYEVHEDQNGNLASQTNYNYTSTADPTSGVVGHGTANAGGPYLTSIRRTITPNVGSSSAINSTVSMTYDDTGAVESTTDANNNPPTTFRYDPTHTFVTEIDKPSTTTQGATYQHISKASYDPNSGAVLSTDDENSVANGQAYTVHYSYEAVAGRPNAVAYPDGGSISYSYPSYTEVDKTTLQNSSTSITVASVVDGYGRASSTSSGGITTTTVYDGNGRPYQVSEPHLTGSSSPTDGTTLTLYDTLNRVTSVVHPDGTSASVQYVGNVATTSDELGHQKQQVTNVFGNITSVFESDPNSGTLSLRTNYFYDGLGNAICIEQQGNTSGTGCSASPASDAGSPWRVRRFFYDQKSELVAASIPEHSYQPSSTFGQQNCGGAAGAGWTDCYLYDPNGNQTGSVDNRAVKRTYTYDSLNRPLMKTSPNGTTHDLGYDAGQNGVGYLSYASNDVSAASTYGYDTMGRVVTETSCRPSNCGTASFSVTGAYDKSGNLTSLTYPDGRVVQNNYDGLNRPLSVIYQQWQSQPQGVTYWSAPSYAPPGQLTAATYGNGVQFQAAFNDRQNLTSLSYVASSSQTAQTYFSKTYQWDKNAANLLLEGNQLNGQTRQFTYDKLNRLVSATDVTMSAAQAKATVTISGVEGSSSVCPQNNSTQAASVSEATPQQQAPPVGKCITVYDSGSLSVTVGTFSASAPYQHLSTATSMASTLSSLLNGSGSPVTATVSGTTITLTAATAGAAGDYALSSTGGDFSASFSGSTMTGGTVSTPVSGGLQQQYALDNWGNLSQMGAPSGFSQPINSQNQVTAYSYDPIGRLTSDGFTQYTYDDDGMMRTSSDGATYTYDAAGQRAAVSTGGGSTEYYYFGGRLVASVVPASGVWTDMIYAGGMRIANVAGTATATPVYALFDHIGSEVASVDNSGNQLSALDYTPFGQIIAGTASSDRHMFTDLLRDNGGLDYAMFRQYASTTGRWTVPDPYDGSYHIGDPQSLNRYAYIGNMPLSGTDPSGLDFTLFVNVVEYSVDSGAIANPWVDVGDAALLLGDLALDAFFGGLFDSTPALSPQQLKAQHQGKSLFSKSNFACAANSAKSLADFLPGNAGHSFLAQTFLGNDFSTATHIAIGPRAVSGVQAIISNPLPLNGTTIIGSALGNITFDLGAMHLTATSSQDSWGNVIYQTIGDLTPIASTAGWKIASKAMFWFSTSKLVFDAGSYSYAFAKCAAQ